VYSDKFNQDKKEYWEDNETTESGFKIDTNTETDGRFHSNWLNMMYSRLLIARQLLKEDGVIFISIDDNEVHHLRKLCDEVFGEENFISNVIWEKKYTVANDAKWFSDTHDHILIYAKNKDIWRPNLLSRTDEMNARYSNPDNHPKGVWKATPLHAKSGSDNNANNEYIFNNKVSWLPPSGTYPRYSNDTLKKYDDNNEIWFGKDNKAIPSRKTFLCDLKNNGVVPKTLWQYDEVGHNHEAREELKDLFEGNAYFDTPKPTKLLKRIFHLGASDNDIILDFFAGSGPTGQAVAELNQKDGGNRKYILVQLPEATDEKSEAYKAGYKKISDITIERNKRVIENLRNPRATFLLPQRMQMNAETNSVLKYLNYKSLTSQE
jgi:adenine-specific DNA-methyltransferase